MIPANWPAWISLLELRSMLKLSLSMVSCFDMSHPFLYPKLHSYADNVSAHLWMHSNANGNIVFVSPNSPNKRLWSDWNYFFLVWYGLNLPALSLTQNVLYISDHIQFCIVATWCVGLYLESTFGCVQSLYQVVYCDSNESNVLFSNSDSIFLWAVFYFVVFLTRACDTPWLSSFQSLSRSWSPKSETYLWVVSIS